MADKPISELNPANSILPADLFVLEQSGEAKSLTGQLLLNWLTAAADGHGGISSITWETSGTSGNGQLHTGTITLADGTVSTVQIRDGYKGDTGAASYLHIKYAGVMPTSDSEMGDTPDKYIGIYSGTASAAPEHYTDYAWYEWKGATGAIGDPARIISSSVSYQESTSGTVIPEGAWSPTIPAVAAGKYLWAKTRVEYNDETVVTSYSVSRNGIDGQGAVSTVNEISPDGNGNVSLEADDIPCSDTDSVQAHITAIEAAVDTLQGNVIYHISSTLTALPASFTYPFITANHRVMNIILGTPLAVTSDLTWTTSSGDVTISGALSGTSTIDFDIVLPASP